MNKECNYGVFNINNLNKSHCQSLEKGSISFEKISNNINSSMPPSPPNGGLYKGPQSNKPWASIPVIPTATNLLLFNLESANPPPGAILQYPVGVRMGNNYTATPGLKCYNDNFRIIGPQ